MSRTKGNKLEFSKFYQRTIDKLVLSPLKELILKTIPRQGYKYSGKETVLSGLWLYVSLKYLDI